MAFGRPWRWPARIGLILGLLILGWAGLGWFVFGVRLPPLQWEPASPPVLGEAQDFRVEADGAIFLGEEEGVLRFRAFVPEPVFLVQAKTATTARLRVDNLHPECVDRGAEAVRIDGLRRDYEFAIEPGEGLMVRPQFPERESYSFAALGDTGSGPELAASLARAAELGADFFLHLGDLHYKGIPLAEAARAFDGASIPSYVAIGNHDFHRGLNFPWRDFQESIGPRNASFTLAGVDFVNLDTAADHYPATSGERGELLDLLLVRPRPEDTLVVFTHRPLVDQRVPLGHIAPERDHALHHASEVAWLREAYLQLGADLVLNGHIHASYGTEVDGIPTWIVGNGLLLDEKGFEGEPQILVARWSAAEPGDLAWRTEPLQAP
jgi:predicted phosphodiesterase